MAREREEGGTWGGRNTGGEEGEKQKRGYTNDKEKVEGKRRKGGAEDGDGREYFNIYHDNILT